MNAATTEPVPAFIAWWRQTRYDRWEKLAGGSTYDAAMDALLDALGAKQGGESIVLAAGRHPSQTAARRGAR